MEIRDLSQTSLAEIVESLVLAFDDYIVKLSSDVDYWAIRFKGARLDTRLSFGVFDGGKLVAFILNGIGNTDGYHTAFNTGTGVLPAYRGQGLVDKIYQFAEASLKASGVEQWKLDVITSNAKAIRVYERIGFERFRLVKCFAGTPPTLPPVSFQLEPLSLEQFAQLTEEAPSSWDHSLEALSLIWDTYQAYEVFANQSTAGWFVINPQTGYVPRLESPTNQWPIVFSALQSISPYLKINAIDESRSELLQALAAWPLPPTVELFEMVRR